MIKLKIDKRTWNVFTEYCNRKGITITEGFNYLIDRIRSRAIEDKGSVVVKEVRPQINIDEDLSNLLKNEARRKRMSSSALVELYINTDISKDLGKEYQQLIEQERAELQKLIDAEEDLNKKILEAY